MKLSKPGYTGDLPHREMRVTPRQLEELLTPEQRNILDTIGMPRGSAMMPAGFGEFDENPFALEVNRSRLHDLLGRLAPAHADDPAATTAEPPSKP